MGHSNITVTIEHYSGLIQSMKYDDDKAFENLLTNLLNGNT